MNFMASRYKTIHYMVLQFYVILSIKIILLHDNSQLPNNLLYQATHYPNCESSPYNHHHSWLYPIQYTIQTR